VRSHLVVAARAAGIEPPVDSVYPHIHDDGGLRGQGVTSRSLGIFGNSPVHPAQLPTIPAIFGPDTDRAWR
jgi:citrate lyase subunit beta / citryl-CoA lyase